MNASRLVPTARLRRKRSRKFPAQAPLRSRPLVIEPLETRALLSASLPTGGDATPTAVPYFLNGFDQSGSTSPQGLTPNQIRAAYGLGSSTSSSPAYGITFTGGIPGDGRGQTIAIVDAYNDPNALSDLNAFSSYFGLPTLSGTVGSSPYFEKLTQAGQPVSTSHSSQNYVANDSNGPYWQTGNSDWEQEESLDIEWAHAMAPEANIILFEANDDSNNGANLFTAVKTAAITAGVVAVSMSWA